MALQWRGTIIGEPASKANSRKQVPRRSKSGKPYVASIKSVKALRYVRSAALQVRPLRPLLTCPVRFTATIYYASYRPDLDESVILDALQGRIYVNDRQVHEKHIFHRIDRSNPRAEIVIESIDDDAPLFKGAAG